VERIPQRFEQLAARCRLANLNRLLVDVTRARMPLSTLDKFEMGRRAVTFGRHGIQVAVVATPDQIDPHRFGELVAINRGVNIRLFTETRAAEEWLMMG
jgi:hypothetical protein